jgi:hypothetical protein
MITCPHPVAPQCQRAAADSSDLAFGTCSRWQSIVRLLSALTQLHTRYLQVVAALRRALDDFFGSKKSRLPRKLLESCLRAHPQAAPQLLPDVLTRAAAARTPFLRAEALALLAHMLRPSKVSC